MEIYYLKKEEFINSINIETLEKFTDGREYKCREKYLEHLCGLFLVRFIAKNIYNVDNTEIILKNHKPVFANHKLNFSISHSKNVVMAAFNNKNIGLDVEYMYPRDYKRIMERYNRNIKNPTRHDFYRFWTLYEAEIKLGAEPKSVYSAFLNEDYIYTCVSDSVIVTKYGIKELTLKSKNINLEEEYTNPQNLKA